MEIRDILKQIMQERGISQKWLADHTGVKEPTISRTLSGGSIPGSDLLLKMGEALNVSCDYLLGRTADPSINSNQQDTEYMIGKAFMRCGDRDRKIILAVLGQYLPAAWEEMQSKVL